MRALLHALTLCCLVGCSLTAPLSGSYSCDANGNCLDGFVCNAQKLCVSPASGSSSGSGTSGSSTSRAGSTSSSSSAVSTASGATSGSSGSKSTGTSSGGTSSGGSSGSSSGCATCTFAGPPPSGSSSGAFTGFAGEWDTDWAHVSLQQSGANVTGTFVAWGWGGYSGYTGWIQGMVQGSVFDGGFNDWQDSPNGAGSGTPEAVTWDLASGGASFWGSDRTSYAWCGSRTGLPLLPGCGWSGTFDTSNWGTATLTQEGDEVRGYASGGCAGLAGTVYFSPNGLEYNGVVLAGGGATTRFSYTLGEMAERQFSGNELALGATGPVASCGFRPDAGTSMPSVCFSGGGPMDGLWLTNLGVLLIEQPVTATSPYTEQYTSVDWSPWGSDGGFTTEYAAINDAISQNQDLPYAQLLSANVGWFDTSPTLGGHDLQVSFSATGLTISGSGNDLHSSLFCGSIYAPDAYANFTDPVGTLPLGCGMTDLWYLWGPSASAALSFAQITQHRDQLSGQGGLVTGHAAASDAGAGVYYTGTAKGLGFNWFLDPQDQTFTGDNGADAGWCGSTVGAVDEPTPCYE